MIIAVLLVAIFISLAVIHIYWAIGGSLGKKAAIPERDGIPLFSPSASLTLLVSFLLFLCALLVAVLAQWVIVPISTRIPTGLGVLLAIVFAIRAVGDFTYTGFFKRIRDTRFARLDSLVYSPLCLLIAVGVALVVLHQHP